MLLRTRVSLFVILVFIVVCLILAFVALKHEELVRDQYSAGIVSDQATLWGKINDNIIQRMEDKAWIAAENNDFHRALAETNHEAVQRIGAEISKKLRDDGIAGRFDAVYADGTLAYSSKTAVFQSPVIVADEARDAMRDGKRVRGLGNDKARNVAAVLGIPLRAADDSVVGMGIYATDINQAIREMEHATDSLVLMVNRRGRVLVGDDDAETVWSFIGEGLELNQIDTLQTAESNGLLYSAVVLGQEVSLGSLVGRVIGLRDVTELASRRDRINQITIGAVGVFLVLVLIALNVYLLRAFAPLTEGVDVLSALSRGDLTVDVEDTGARDEIGRVISAVDVFRDNLIAVDRIRRSRRRQYDRQERFIHREMTQLADTLDEEEKQAVLKEMAELEREIAEAVNKSSRDMAMEFQDDNDAPDARETDSMAIGRDGVPKNVIARARPKPTPARRPRREGCIHRVTERIGHRLARASVVVAAADAAVRRV